MGRFHVCMPVADGDGYCCALCRQDMSWEMSQYAVEAPGTPGDPVAASSAERADGALQGRPPRDRSGDS